MRRLTVLLVSCREGLRDPSGFERLREQEALIEEARRRRQGYAAFALFGVAVAVAIALARVGGGHSRVASDVSVPSGQGAAAATNSNGKIAFADDRGGLQVADSDGTGARVIAHCRWPAPEPPSCVGFFDFNHGQTGVAPNAIELHPVLGFGRARCR
jgi:hypothetical protein